MNTESSGPGNRVGNRRRRSTASFLRKPNRAGRNAAKARPCSAGRRPRPATRRTARTSGGPARGSESTSARAIGLMRQSNHAAASRKQIACKRRSSASCRSRQRAPEGFVRGVPVEKVGQLVDIRRAHIAAQQMPQQMKRRVAESIGRMRELHTAAHRDSAARAATRTPRLRAPEIPPSLRPTTKMQLDGNRNFRIEEIAAPLPAGLEDQRGQVIGGKLSPRPGWIRSPRLRQRVARFEAVSRAVQDRDRTAGATADRA